MAISEIDKVDQIDKQKIDINAGLLWLLQFEVVNLDKQELPGYEAPRCFVLMDSEGYEFEYQVDYHLCCFGEFAREYGLRMFGGLGGDNLLPKLVVRGGVMFLLPDEEHWDYSLRLKEGSLTEV